MIPRKDQKKSEELVAWVSAVLSKHSPKNEDIPESLADIEGIGELNALLWGIRHMAFALRDIDLEFAGKGKGSVFEALKELQGRLTNFSWHIKELALRISEEEAKYKQFLETSLKDVTEISGEFAGMSVGDEETLDLFHDQIALKGLNESLYHIRKLAASAERDSLTGMFNRRAFARRVGEILKHMFSERLPSVIIMADIDHFKDINDMFGHQCGDEVLRVFSRKIMSWLRPQDMACRYGGEEFVVLLTNTSLADGADVAERLRAGTEAMLTRYDGKDIRFTASFGVSTFNFDGVSEDFSSPVSLKNVLIDAVKRADDCLYEAKSGGRNVVFCEGVGKISRKSDDGSKRETDRRKPRQKGIHG